MPFLSSCTPHAAVACGQSWSEQDKIKIVQQFPILSIKSWPTVVEALLQLLSDVWVSFSLGKMVQLPSRRLGDSGGETLLYTLRGKGEKKKTRKGRILWCPMSENLLSAHDTQQNPSLAEGELILLLVMQLWLSTEETTCNCSFLWFRNNAFCNLLREILALNIWNQWRFCLCQTCLSFLSCF